jgi:single-strand DNA-binding protein
MTVALGTTVEHRNEVVVAGRLSAAAVTTHLPSGDEIVTWRLVVDRPRGANRSGFDTVNCVAYTARVRRQALGWCKDDVIEISGALRCRFWRGPGGLRSRYEVEVRTATRLTGSVKRPRKPG